jgi:hypothetical protein
MDTPLKYCCDLARYICDEYCDIKLYGISMRIRTSCSSIHAQEHQHKLDYDNLMPTLKQLYAATLHSNIIRCYNLPYYMQCIAIYSPYLGSRMHYNHSKSLKLSTKSLETNLNYGDYIIIYNRYYYDNELGIVYNSANLYCSPNLYYMYCYVCIRMLDYLPHSIIAATIRKYTYYTTNSACIGNIYYDNLPIMTKPPPQIKFPDECISCGDYNNYGYKCTCIYLRTINLRNMPKTIIDCVTGKID